MDNLNNYSCSLYGKNKETKKEYKKTYKMKDVFKIDKKDKNYYKVVGKKK